MIKLVFPVFRALVSYVYGIFYHLFYTVTKVAAIHFERKSMQASDIYYSSIYGADCSISALPKVKANICNLLNIMRDRMLPLFISEHQSKHPRFVLGSFGAAYYCY